MSVGSILNTARSGMAAQQLAVQIASQNVSNAQTEGYSRQRVELATKLSTVYPYGTVGTGVDVVGITRARDTMLDATFRANTGARSQSEATSTALSQIQSVFGEPSDSGLAATLDAFWSSWNDLANDPTSGSAKAAVRAAGATVAATLNRFASQIDQIADAHRVALGDAMTEVNTLSRQVADYNNQIVSAESNGNQAGDLRDARDRLLDRLSALTGSTTVERSNGSVAVFVAGRMLIDGTTAKTIVSAGGTPPSVTFSGTSTEITGIGGKIGAEIEVAGTHIPAVMAQLDALASTLVKTTNAIHTTGKAYSGSPPVGVAAGNFFEMASPASATDPYLTARGISLASTLTGADKVAASSAAAAGPGDNSVANAMAALRNGSVAVASAGGTSYGTASIGGFFSQIVGDVASSVKSAEDDAAVQKTLSEHAEARRQSVSGVSTDEELVSIIQHQHAYQAAARLVSVVDDMMQTLIDLGR